MNDRRWLEMLSKNKNAMARIEYILDHTLDNEDGGVFPTIADAADLFAIMWMARTSMENDFEDWVGATAEDVPFVDTVETGTSKVDEAQDTFEFVPRGDKRTDMALFVY